MVKVRKYGQKTVRSNMLLCQDVSLHTFMHQTRNDSYKWISYLQYMYISLEITCWRSKYLSIFAHASSYRDLGKLFSWSSYYMQYAGSAFVAVNQKGRKWSSDDMYHILEVYLFYILSLALMSFFFITCNTFM